jgi:hypothetical protein
LLAYRPLAKELYLKERQLEMLGLTSQLDKGEPLQNQYSIQERICLIATGVSMAIGDLQHHKAAFDKDLLASDFSHIRYITIHFDCAPDVMCSGAFQPEYTFDGVLIQELGKPQPPLQFTSFSLIATDTGGAAVFSWRDDSDAACSALVDSLLRISQDDIPHALLRFAVSDFENTYMRPDWWEQLPVTTQTVLEDKVNHKVNLDIEVKSDYLAEDGLRAVDWKVTKIDAKRR